MAWAKFWSSVVPNKRLFTRHVRCDRRRCSPGREQLLESARREAEEELGIAGVPLPSTGSSISKIKIAVSGALVQLRLSRSLRPTGR